MPSRSVVSNQDALHPDLADIVKKHLAHQHQKPIRPSSTSAFLEILPQIEGASSIILDSCCGVGESTIEIAKKNPNSLVLGLDKSEERLDKFSNFYRSKLEAPKNAHVIRTDIYDFWKLFHSRGFFAEAHYILYPNPWPKKQHLMRRIHGHPLFFLIPKISKKLTLRTNWKIYAEECSLALGILGEDESRVEEFEVESPITPFERKYSLSGQKIYQLNQVLRDKLKCSRDFS